VTQPQQLQDLRPEPEEDPRDTAWGEVGAVAGMVIAWAAWRFWLAPLLGLHPPGG